VIGPAELRAAVGDVQETIAASPAGLTPRSLKQVAEDAARAAEREAIRDALRAAQGNQARAARALQIDYKTMHVKLKRLGLRARDYQV
jgi:two-component system nitrogen regulation response regulator GlnG